MLVTRIHFADDDADLPFIAKRVEVLDVGDRRGLECAFHENASLVRADVAGVDAEAADLRGGGHGHLPRFSNARGPERIHAGRTDAGSSDRYDRCWS
jgi:hypothetical protein